MTSHNGKQLDKLCFSALPSLQTLFWMCILMCKCDAVWENKILDLTQEALTKSVPADGISQMYFQTNSLYFDWKNHYSSVCDQWWFWKKKEHLMTITGLQFSILDVDKFIKQIQIHFFNEIWCVFNFLPAWENLLGFSGKKREIQNQQWLIWKCVYLQIKFSMQEKSFKFLHWPWGNYVIAPVPVKKFWKIWVKSTIA